MCRTVIVLVLFIVGMFYELQEIIAFEKRQKQNNDEEFRKLFRKCHWTYFLIFIGGAADRIVALIEKLN